MRDEQGYTETKEEVPEIHRAEARLAEEIGAVIFAVEQLDNRLERVMRPADHAEPDGPDMLSQVRPVTAPLTDFLNTQANRATAVAAQLNDIIGRLAL